MCVQESNQEVTKVISVVKNGGKSSGVSIYHKGCIPTN